MSVWIPDKGVCLVTCTLVTLGWLWGTPKMGVDGFAEAWGVRKSRQGVNWRAVELFSAQTTYFCQTSCLKHTHTHAHAHTHTQCAFTVCYSVTAVTLGISPPALSVAKHIHHGAQRQAFTDSSQLQIVKLICCQLWCYFHMTSFFFSWNLNYSTGIPLKMDPCTTLQIFLFPALWHHKIHHLHLFKHLIFTS